jgi:hypothetical protein
MSELQYPRVHRAVGWSKPTNSNGLTNTVTFAAGNV